MRQAGEVVYADAHRIRPNEGFVQRLFIYRVYLDSHYEVMFMPLLAVIQ